MDEQRLIQAAQGGNEKALAELLDRYTSWVRTEARRMAQRIPGGIGSLDDLVQEGLLGVREALRRYDPARGTPFFALAKKYVLGRMYDYWARQLGLSDEARRRFGRVMQTYKKLREELEREPMAAEVAERSGVPLEVVKEIFETLRPPCTLDDIEIPGEEPAISGDLFERLVRMEVPRGLKVKFIVLGILRDGFGYKWDEIVDVLRRPDPPIAGWEATISYYYTSFVEDFPELCNYAGIHRLFQEPPPALTPAALRQFYSRLSRYI